MKTEINKDLLSACKELRDYFLAEHKAWLETVRTDSDGVPTDLDDRSFYFKDLGNLYRYNILIKNAENEL